MFTTRPEIAGTFGAVATTHWIASSVGMAVLERGGNAFDAACAAGFTLQVVEPHLNGPLGDCPIILHSAALGTQQVICGQGPAPAGLSVAHVAGHLGLDLMPGTGFLAAPIPGAFDAWARMLLEHGTWRLRDVLEYAIGYARNGAHMVPRVRAAVENVRPLFESEWTTSAAIWLRDGGPEAGGLYANPTLAETYARLLREAEAPGRSRENEIEAARQAWYGGFVAEAVERFARTPAMDTSGRRHAGVLTAHDMAQWRVGVEQPLAHRFMGHDVLKCGPWSQGPAMLQTLALLEGFDLAAMDPVGAEFVHHVAEAMKLAFADREAFYGDPDFTDAPMAALLSDAYTAERRKLMGAQASMEFRPGRPEGREARGVDYPAAIRRAEEMQAAAGSGEPTVSRLGAAGGDTCHVDIIDRHGNFVSATPSAGWLQSSPAIPSWASASARAARCSGWTRRCPTGCSPASGRAPPSRPRLCCATAGLG
jgi:gamma-glutamyltranspeptidase/glutathione hydrolase